MATSSDDSSNSSSSVTEVDQTHEYYEELDNRTLDFRARKAPTPIPIPKQSFVKEPPPSPVDPIQKLNEELNRRFRPDLVSPSPSPPPISSKPIRKRTPSPNPVIFDARAKPIKSTKKKKEPSVSLKQTRLNHINNTTEPTTTQASSFKLGMPHHKTTADGFQVPPGMMLVAAPPRQSQALPTVSQYKPPTLNNNAALKTNKVAPPPSIYNSQTVNHSFPSNSFQSPSSMMSTNHLIESSYALQQQQQQQRQQNLFKHIDESKSNKKKHRKQSKDNLTNTNNSNRAFALYNQQNGRIEGVVKNRINVANNDIDESKILDDDIEPKSDLGLWLSQPLCLGLTRLSGGLLFGSMIILGLGAIAGLIVSIVLYSQDSVTDAQWKILGMVVCAIMLITIIITLLIFVCCYKQGYMFDKDEDDDPTNPLTTHDVEGNEQPKAVLRKIYKFNRPNDSPPIPSNKHNRASTSTASSSSSPPVSQPSVYVDDKQTNTEGTIAVVRPKDLHRGVWPSTNAYGGIVYRPSIPPQMVTRFIQVLPHEIEQAMQPPPPPPPAPAPPPPPQVIYQAIAPTAAAVPPQQVQQRVIQIPTPETSIEYVEAPQTKRRTIQIPAQQAPVIEYVEATQNQRRTIHMPAQQGPIVEYVEAPQNQRRATIIRQPQAQQIVVQPTTHIEYVDSDDHRGHRIVQQPQYVDSDDHRGHRIVQQPQYVDAGDRKARRIVQQPQYEIVEEVTDRPTSPSSIAEVVEIVDEQKRGRRHGRKKEKKQGFRKVSVKHLKSAN